MIVTDEIISLQRMEQNDVSHELVGWLNDPEVVRFSQQRHKYHTLKTANDYFQSFSRSENMYLKIVECKSQKMIGTMTVYRNFEDRSADIGILVGEKSVWGTGYGTRAWALLMRYLYEVEELDCITGGCEAKNFGMIRIFQKLGMTEAEQEIKRYKDNKPIRKFIKFK